MTTNYLLKSNKRQSTLSSLITRLSIVVVVCIVLGLLIHKPLVSVADMVIMPGAIVRPSVQNVKSYIRSLTFSKYNLQENIKNLQDENASLRDQVALFEADSKLLSAGSGTSSGSFILARVSIRPPYIPYDTLVVSQGSKAGVVAGAKVYPVGRLIPIGRVVDVSMFESRIALFSSPTQTLAVTIGTSTEEWSAQGMGGGMFEVRIPQSKKIQSGDTVTIPRESPIPFSAIGDISSEPSDPFQVARFLLPVPFGSLDAVAISKTSQ